MSDRDYRGGDIVLKAGKPRGLPLLRPLYGLPPYQYTGDVVLMIVYEAAEASIREVLPRELEPLPGNIVADDPIARLAPLRVLSALHGTLDDLYPATIRVLGKPARREDVGLL